MKILPKFLWLFYLLLSMFTIQEVAGQTTGPTIRLSKAGTREVLPNSAVYVGIIQGPYGIISQTQSGRPIGDQGTQGVTDSNGLFNYMAASIVEPQPAKYYLEAESCNGSFTPILGPNPYQLTRPIGSIPPIQDVLVFQINLIDESGNPIPNGSISINNVFKGFTATSLTGLGNFATLIDPNQVFSVTATVGGASKTIPNVTESMSPLTIILTTGTIPYNFTVQDQTTNPPTPVVGASIFINGAPEPIGTTDENGQLNNVNVPNQSFTVNVTADDYQQTILTVSNPVAGGRTTISLNPSTIPYNFIVEDQNTLAPIPNASIIINDEVIGTTDANGKLNNVQVPNQTFQVLVTVQNYQDAIQTIENPQPNGTATIFLTEQTITYNFTVVNNSTTPATPIPGATIAVNGTPLPGTTDANGELNNQTVPNQTFEIQVSAPGFETTTQTVTNPQENGRTTIALVPKPATITYNFTVKDQNSNPIAMAMISVNNTPIGTTDANGQLNNVTVPNETFEVEVSGLNIQPTVLTVNNPVSGGRTVITVQTNQSKSFLFTIIEKGTGANIQGANISVNNFSVGSTNQFGQLRTDVPIGLIHVEVQATGYFPVTNLQIDTASTNSTTISLVKVPVTTFTVQVIDRFTNTPVQGASVLATSAETDQPVANGTTGASGSVALMIPQDVGAIILTVTHAGYKPFTSNPFIPQPKSDFLVLLEPGNVLISEPTDLRFRRVECSKNCHQEKFIQLSWSPPEENAIDVVQYNVYRFDAQGNQILIGSVPVQTTANGQSINRYEFLTKASKKTVEYAVYGADANNVNGDGATIIVKPCNNRK